MKTTAVSLLTVTLTAGTLTMAAPFAANAGQVHIDVHLGIPLYAEPVVVYQPAYPVVVYRPPVVYHAHGWHKPRYYRHHYHRHHGHHQGHGHNGGGNNHSKRWR